MTRIPFSAGSVLRQMLFTLSFGFALLLAGCTGSTGSTPSAAAGTAGASGTISGTAATGAALAGFTVTVKDSTGKIATATTSATGAYTLSTSGLTAPFLVQITLPSGTRLYSVSADLNTATVVNITPVTDLILRSWYGVQGITPDSAFANPSGAPAPTALQVRTIAQTILQVLQLALNNNAAGITDAAELISKPFVADHTGLDRLLDNARFVLGSGSITFIVTGGGTTQTTVISYNTSTMGLAANSTTVNGSSTSTSSVSTVVPVQSAQATALQDISAGLATFASIVNTKKTSLTVTDVISFLDVDLLSEGRNRQQFAENVVKNFGQGQSVGFSVLRINNLNSTTGVAEVVFRATETLGSQSSSDVVTFAFKKTGSSWLIYGDRQLGSIRVQAEGRRNQGQYTGGNGPSISFEVRAPQASVTSVIESSSNLGIAQLTLQGQTNDSGLVYDQFFYSTANAGPLSSPLPAAGTPFTLTLTKASGGTLSYVIPLNAFTTELIQITNLTDVTVAGGARLGSALTVTWTLPTTYAVQRVKLGAVLVTPLRHQCFIDAVGVIGPTTTTGTINMPLACPGFPGESIVQVNINVSTDGVNGERSQAIYQMGNAF